MDGVLPVCSQRVPQQEPWNQRRTVAEARKLAVTSAARCYAVATITGPSSLLRRFGPFEVDTRSGEVRRQGRKVELQEQPFRALAALLEHPGDIVTREELQKRLWPDDTFVDFERGLNKAINKLRAALRDDAENPRYIETLPQRGYRFIAPVELLAVAPAEVAPPEPAAEAIGGLVRKSSGRLAYLFGAVVAVGIAAVVVWTIWAASFRVGNPPKVLRFTRLTNDGQVKEGPLSSDGSRIYFNEMSGDRQRIIAQVSVLGGETVPLKVPLARPQMLDLSKDGTDALVSNDEGSEQASLWVQPVVGGAARRVGTAMIEDARFTPTGNRIIYSSGREVLTANRDGSAIQKLVTADSVPFAFRYSPDGKAIRFTQFDFRVDSMNIMEATADGKRLKKMLGGCCGAWTADGKFYIYQTRSEQHTLDLWALPEGNHLPWQRHGNEAIELASGPINFRYPLPSADGRKIFAIGESHQAELIRYDDRSKQFVPYLAGISAEGLAFSRDGQWVAYTSYPDGILWRSKLDGSERLQLTFPPNRVLLPRWSPDGRQIAFNAMALNTGETWKTYLVSSEGGAAREIAPSKQSQTDVNWSPDGSSLVFGTQIVPGQPIYSVDVKSGRVSTVPGSNGLFSPRWSPDGKHIAALTTERPFRLMVFDVAAQKWTAMTDTDATYPCFSRDGKNIYFQAWRDPVQQIGERIVRMRLVDGKVETIVDVEKIGRLPVGTITDWFGLSPDDNPLFARDISTQEVYALEMRWP